MKKQNSDITKIHSAVSQISEELVDLENKSQNASDSKIEKHIEQLKLRLKDVTEKLNGYESAQSNFNKINRSKSSLSKWEYDIDEKGNLINVSQGAIFVTGYSPKEFITDKNLLSKIIYNDDKNIFDEHLSQYPSSDSVEQVTFRIITKSGAIRWISHICFPIFYDGDNTKIRRITNIDITDEKEGDKWLKLKGKILEVAPVGIIITDKDGKISWVNSAFSKITGYTSIEVIGKSTRLFKSDIHGPAFYKKMWKTILAGKIWKGEIINKKKNGEEYFEEMVISPSRGNNGEIANFIAIKEDITERKNAEEQIERYIEEIYENKDLVEQNAHELVELNVKLEQSEDKLKILNANKDRFFSIIAHDLKNPFTALIGYTEMMLADFDELGKDEILEFMTTTYKTSKNVFSLLEGLLDWSRLQLGSFTLQPHNLSLTEIGKKVYDLYENSANQKGIKLINAIEKNVAIFIDENAVFTTLRNLVSNAIKFTPRNGEIKYSSRNIENNFCKITITDSGIGMDEETINKLFQIEVHHTTLGTDKEKGTGLGLLLCKDLIEKSGGEIWVDSQKGKGSKFIFTVPLAK